MVELKVASEKEIRDELKRREMIARDERITSLFKDITIAYNSGMIDHINVDEQNKGTSVMKTSYHVFLK